MGGLNTRPYPSEKRVEEGRRGFHRNGETFTCKDPLLETKGNIVLGMKLPELSAVKFFRPDDPKTSLNRAFDLLTSLPRALLETVAGALPESEAKLREERINKLHPDQNSETTTGEDGFNQADYVPLLIGSLVDLLIFIAALHGNGLDTGTDNTYLKRLVGLIGVGDGDADADPWDLLEAYVRGEGT